MKPLRWLILLVALGAARVSVSMDDMKFSPSSVSVRVGDTVTWTNNDDRDHDVSAADGSFKSENIKPGGSYSFTFTKAGKFAYSCTYHPRMKGSVTVAEK